MHTYIAFEIMLYEIYNKWCVHLGFHTSENTSQDKILDYPIIAHKVRTNIK